ncbi:MAG: metallophosphoesterase [Micromonosporaceae bacterium]|nr:metallophosphoesterase [Micromonosporaceae bacterium]
MRPLLRIAKHTLIAGTATLAYASLIERHLFTLRRFDVRLLRPVSSLRHPAQPLRILHLSDLHLTPNQRRKIRWVQRLADLDPDLVIVTGDNLATVDSVPAVLEAFQPLLGRPGAFVFGSNDYRGPVLKNPLDYFRHDRPYVQGVALPAAELRDALAGAGWIDCNNTRGTIKVAGCAIDLVGVDDPHVERDVYPDPNPVDTNADLRIGLLHTPEPRVLDTMAADGCLLVLAGHTHGGQVRVPLYGALISNCDLHPSLARGLHRWRGSDAYLHVSAGLGTHPTAPIRFACLPEASLLTVSAR